MSQMTCPLCDEPDQHADGCPLNDVDPVLFGNGNVDLKTTCQIYGYAPSLFDICKIDAEQFINSVGDDVVVSSEYSILRLADQYYQQRKKERDRIETVFDSLTNQDVEYMIHRGILAYLLERIKP